MDEGDSSKEVLSGQRRLVPLSSLKVFELKEELGKRGLDKTGVKVALIERLLVAMRSEGHDPETYLFSVTEYAKETSSSVGSPSRLEAASQPEQSTGNDELKDVDKSIAIEEVETTVGEGSQHEDPLVAANETDVEMCDESKGRDVEEHSGEGQTEVGKETKEKTIAVVDHVKSEVESTPSSASISTADIQSTKSCSVWVKGISANVKASHLKTLFAQCGRVVSAKIFIRRNQPTNSYVGFVAMINAVCAERCVQLFNKTSFHGNILTVELANEKRMAHLKQSDVSVTSPTGKGVESGQASHQDERGSEVTRCSNVDMKDVTEADEVDHESADRKGGSAVKEHLQRRYHEEMKQHLASSGANVEQEKGEGAGTKKRDEKVEQQVFKKSAVMAEERERTDQGITGMKSGAQPELTNALLKSSRSLWVRGIGADTKAAHLKTMFSKCGRVVTAKVFVRRQLTSNVYFGFLSMANVEGADNCVQQFNRAVLNGQQITVERADHSGMAVRLPEIKKEDKGMDAVIDREESKNSKEKEDAGKNAKAGEKRNPASLAGSTESKRQFSVKDDYKRGRSTRREEHNARHPEKPATSRQFTATARSSMNERKLTHNVFKARRTIEATRHTRVNSGAIRKPLRSLLTAKPTRTTKHKSFGRGAPGRIAPAATYRPEKRNYARIPSHSTAHPVIGRSTYEHSTTSIRPLVSGVDSSIGGYEERCFNSTTASADLYHRISGSPVASWEKHETMETLRRKEESFRLQEEERRLQEERDRLRQERGRIERERMMLEREREEREKRARFAIERAQRERVVERHRTEHGRTERRRVVAEREHAERQRIAVENERAERQRIMMEREREEREQIRLEKERVAQERLRIEHERERIRAERERADRLRAEQERLRVERERAERLRQEQERVEQQRLKAERERAERERNERIRAEQERVEQQRLRAEHERAERERAEREKAAERERLRAERERVEKERAERQRLEAERERIKAEKERTERERLRLERERIERERLQLERLRVEAERERLKAEADHERLRGIEGERGQAEFGRHSDRLKTQMERMERERLELEQLRQLAALTASEAMSTFAPNPRISVRESANHQELDLPRRHSSRHRGAYALPDERFASFATGSAMERYSTANVSPIVTSRFGADREREHSRHDAALDSYGGGLGVQDVSYDYRTHLSGYDRRSEPETNTSLPLGRDILSLRYNSERRRDASYTDATRSAIFENHVGRTTRDVPAPLTVPYSLQQQGVNKDSRGGTSSEATTSGYNMSKAWSLSGSGVAPGGNPYMASECGDTSGGIWSQLSSISATQRCSANDSGTWLPAQQGIWIGQQPSTGLAPVDGKISSFGEQGTSSRRLSELKPEAARLTVDDQRRRSLQGTSGRQGKQKMVVGSKNVDRGRSGGHWSGSGSRY